MENMILSICVLEITSALCSSAFVVVVKWNMEDPEILTCNCWKGQRLSRLGNWCIKVFYELSSGNYAVRGHSCAISMSAFGIYPNFHITWRHHQCIQLLNQHYIWLTETGDFSPESTVNVCNQILVVYRPWPTDFLKLAQTALAAFLLLSLSSAYNIGLLAYKNRRFHDQCRYGWPHNCIQPWYAVVLDFFLTSTKCHTCPTARCY